MASAAVDFTPLLRKWPPKHPTVHRPKRRERTNVHANTVLDRLPSQGVTNWAKQDSIPVGQPTPGLWVNPPARGMAVVKKKKGGKK